MSANVRKYGFDTEFAPDGAILREGAARPKLLKPEEVEAERAAAYESGKRDAIAEAERQAAAALAELSKAGGAVLKHLNDEAAAMRVEAARIALIAARKIAGEALDSFGVERAAAALERAMDGLRHQPRLIVELDPPSAEKLRERIEAIAANHGYDGAVIVRDNAGARAGRVSIDWSDGVATLDPDDITARIEAIIEDALTSHEAGS